MINVGVIGYGMSAKTFHFPLISANSNYRITALVSSQTNLNLAPYPHIKRYASTQSMLAESQVDIVVNTAPNALHYDLTVQCLKAHKHVVLEKPMTISVQEAQNLLALAKKNNLLLSVFHNRRLDSDFLTIKKLIHQGRLGQIRVFQSNWDRFRPHVRDRWRENAGPGSGIWFDLGPHLIDQALMLFGLPLSISANIRSIRPNSQSDDYAHVLLHYADLEVILNTSPYSTALTMRFKIEGDKASYIKYGLDPQESQLKDGLSPNDPTFGIEPESASGKIFYPDGNWQLVTSEKGRFSDYYGNLAAAILHKSPLAVLPEQAVQVMSVLLTAKQSAEQGRELPINPR